MSTILSTNSTNEIFSISAEVISTSDPISFDSIPSNTAITSSPNLTSIHDTPSFPLSNVSRYSDSVFEGIMIDTGAAKVSTGGQDQFYALRKTLNLELESKTAGQAKICFGIGTATSIGSTTVRTPIGEIVLHILPSDTPFLLCLRDMDRLNVRFDNLRNILVQGNKTVPIVRKWGHPWMLLHSHENQWCTATFEMKSPSATSRSQNCDSCTDDSEIRPQLDFPKYCGAQVTNSTTKL
ncbi:hypothetical protein K3495_g10102 [Podosphaera aphanis]|nr:hypothetical protein K3495_g10102 [Podosphaera aphanis]